MTFSTGCFPPTPKFLPYLQAYLTKCSGPKASSAREKKFATVSLRRLAKIASIGPRTRPPSVSEIEATKVYFDAFLFSLFIILMIIYQMHRKVPITIYLPTGRAVTLRVESTSTASIMCKRMCKRLHLDSSAKWAFFETYNELGISPSPSPLFFCSDMRQFQNVNCSQKSSCQILCTSGNCIYR